MEAARPDQPLGYLLEAEARWWQIYCETCQIKWNMIDAWPQPRRAVDDSYLSLADQVTSLAEAHIAKGDSAEMELYAAWAGLLRARLLALRNQRLATARAGVNARNRFLRCLALDPQMDDAYTGLGIYNYFVDTFDDRQDPALLYGHSGRTQGRRHSPAAHRHAAGRADARHGAILSCQEFAHV